MFTANDLPDVWEEDGAGYIPLSPAGPGLPIGDNTGKDTDQHKPCTTIDRNINYTEMLF